MGQNGGSAARSSRCIALVGPYLSGKTTLLEAILARIPPAPPNHQRIVAQNESGQWPDGDPVELEAGANRCAVT